jgi:CBS domain-containing protein
MATLSELLGKTPRVVQVSPDSTVREAAKAMAEANVGCAAILDGQELVGLFTERDVLKRVLLMDLVTDEVKVAEVMTKEIITGDLEMSSRDARRLLKEHHIRHLPVVDADGKLNGVLSIRDLVLDEVQEMRDYIALSEG